MGNCIKKLYYNPLAARVLHTSVYCLENELKNCERVLDLGCGPDSPLQYCKNIKYSVGVEAFEPYLKESQAKKIHSKYLKRKIEDVSFPDNSFDAVIMIDVLEHIPKETAQKVLLNAEKWARKKIILTTPNGFFPMGEVDDNSWQKHRSGWTPEELEKLGFSCKGLAGMKFLYGNENLVSSMTDKSTDNFYRNIKFKPKIFFYFFNSLLQIFSYYFPRFSFELFAVKKLNKKIKQ